MSQPVFKKAVIVGVGLIGGSLGLAIRERGLAKTVVGVVRKKTSGVFALKKNAVDQISLDLKSALSGADLVLLCAPVSVILKQIKMIRPYLDPNVLVMDAASAKMLVDQASRKYLKGVRFVGAHPMAGSSQKGVGAADKNLFQGAVCFLTDFDKQAEFFWKNVGCRVAYLTPQKHDQWVSQVSHLPHILAFGLFGSRKTRDLKDLHLSADNPSVRELARLAKSDPELWADILVCNKREILKSLADYQKSIQLFSKALGAGRPKAIQAFIRAANQASHKIAPQSV